VDRSGKSGGKSSDSVYILKGESRDFLVDWLWDVRES